MVVDQYDVFVSHAWEDKETFVRPLVEELVSRGLTVWYDELALDVGDSLRESIDRGLAESSYGVVVLSHAFFAKQWPTRELNGLVAKAMGEGRKVVLPVWHGVTRQDVESYSYPLADLVAARSDDGVPAVADAVERVVRNAATEGTASAPLNEAPTLRLIATAKGMISDPTQVVAVNDLTDAIARESFAELTALYSDILQDANPTDVASVLSDYRQACFGLARLCSLGANLGHPDHFGSWERAVAIIAREPVRPDGRGLIEGVWQYPSAYLLYAIGVAAIQRGRLELVVRILISLRPEQSGSTARVPFVHWLKWDRLGMFVKSEPENRNRTPLSESLYAGIQDVVMDYFIDESEFDRVFDLFEFTMLCSHFAAETDKGYRWLPPARLMWRYEHSLAGIDGVAKEFEALGGVATLFKGDEAEYALTVGIIKDAISKRQY